MSPVQDQGHVLHHIDHEEEAEEDVGHRDNPGAGGSDFRRKYLINTCCCFTQVCVS